jgi:DNA-binding IclR family transcriptional regulator
LLDEELHQQSESNNTSITNTKRQFERHLTEIREQGLARATGSLTPGINGFSAPVFDHSGTMTAAITSLGSAGDFNAEWDSPVAKAMLIASRKLSKRLGNGTEHSDS